jgi:hypothetical protein
MQPQRDRWEFRVQVERQRSVDPLRSGGVPVPRRRLWIALRWLAGIAGSGGITWLLQHFIR